LTPSPLPLLICVPCLMRTSRLLCCCLHLVRTTVCLTISSPFIRSSFVSRATTRIPERAVIPFQMAVSSDLLELVSQEVSHALGRSSVQALIAASTGGGFSGGGGASTNTVVDATTKTKYFLKSASATSAAMLRAEYLGVQEMANSQTIRVPTPICCFPSQEDEERPQRHAFVVFEYLQFCSGGSDTTHLLERTMGVQLAKMHRCLSDRGFGFYVDNTIGATLQPNLPWKDDWADFWDTHRLGHMLDLTDNAGFSDDDIQTLRLQTKTLLSHNPAPSLLHGDLWGGNKGFAREADGTVVPVIFDPATYYGDREADIAMTHLFGGFGSAFYQGYESEWPLPEVRICTLASRTVFLLGFVMIDLTNTGIRSQAYPSTCFR
jgi:fructosamine-3-kinase